MTTTTMVEQLREWANQLDDNTVGGLEHHATVVGVVAGLRAVADDIERTPPAVWVLTVSHRHGWDTTVHETQDSARAALAGYCCDWWDEANDETDPETLTQDELIRRYFEGQAEESYELVPAQVQP